MLDQHGDFDLYFWLVLEVVKKEGSAFDKAGDRCYVVGCGQVEAFEKLLSHLFAT